MLDIPYSRMAHDDGDLDESLKDDGRLGKINTIDTGSNITVVESKSGKIQKKMAK